MLNTDMNLILQAYFYKHMQQFEEERTQNRHRRNRSHRPLNVRGRVGNLLVAVGRRLQTLDNAYAEPTA